MSPPPVPGRETPAEIDLFRTLLLDRSGLDLGPQRQAFLWSRVRRRMARAGARSLYEYYRLVAGVRDGGELQALVEDVSIHETAFFRNPAQFSLLGTAVVPDRVSERLRSGDRRLSLWSAGCSTGQELYSIAMAVQESAILPAPWEVRLLGTDISAQALDRAAAGVYTAAQMAGVSEERRNRFFDRRGDDFAFRQWARRGIELARLNLLDEAPMREVDVIFCRNVMIYFDCAGQRRLLRRLADALAPNGYLFLGHTESPWDLGAAFRMVSLGRGIAYRRLT